MLGSQNLFNGKKVLWGMTNCKTDSNGASWISYNPNFGDDNVFMITSALDTNVVDRVEYIYYYNGAACVFYKDGEPVRNNQNDVWVAWLAIGTPYQKFKFH